VIGTGTSGGGNVISGNGNEGIRVAFADSCTVRGNLIGTTADGTGDLGNGFGGIQFISTGVAVVGGPTVPERNTISGNRAGIGVSDSAVDVLGNTIAANDFSGLSFSGTTTGTVQGNVVVGNAASGGNGIQVTPGAVVRITGNQILNNGGLGINLVGGTEDGFGVTANDAGDPDSGPNGLQNYPVITAAMRQSNGVTLITGQLNSSADTRFRIELFLTSGGADLSGNGEAVALLAAQTITTNGTGNRNFAFQVAGLQQGHLVTMSAIRVSNGATSEFADNVPVVQTGVTAHLEPGS
jgi:parallel beta-helix repeat protein